MLYLFVFPWVLSGKNDLFFHYVNACLLTFFSEPWDHSTCIQLLNQWSNNETVSWGGFISKFAKRMICMCQKSCRLDFWYGTSTFCWRLSLFDEWHRKRPSIYWWLGRKWYLVLSTIHRERCWTVDDRYMRSTNRPVATSHEWSWGPWPRVTLTMEESDIEHGRAHSTCLSTWKRWIDHVSKLVFVFFFLWLNFADRIT